MADDLAGLKQTLKDTFDALVIDKAAHNHEDELQIWRLFIGLIRAKATSNGVTGL